MKDKSENGTFDHQDDSFYEQLIDQLPCLIVLMDKKSRFLYSNNYTAKLFGYNSRLKMLDKGIDAHGMRCPAVESAEQFIKQDKHVMETLSTLTILDIHGYATNETKILLTKKLPVFINSELIGTVCQCTEIYSDSLLKTSAFIMQTDQQYYSKSNRDSRSYVVDNILGHTTLSKREKDCIFYLIRGNTMKEIAQILQLSWRTVESYINNVKFKWRCTNKKEVVAYAISHGFLNYIPQNVLDAESSFILSEGPYQNKNEE